MCGGSGAPLNGHNPENIKESRVEPHHSTRSIKGGPFHTYVMHIKKYFITNSNKEHVNCKGKSNKTEQQIKCS